MRWVWVLILALSLQGCFTWSQKDKAKLVEFVTLQGIDTWQSVGFIEDGKELNPLYENNEALFFGKFLSIGLVYGLAEIFPEARPMILNLGCGITGGVVIWNLSQ